VREAGALRHSASALEENEHGCYEALYTTRAMRRVKPDPIPMDVQKRIMDAAIRAPSGGNAQGWRFLWVDDAALKAKLGPIYRDCLSRLWSGVYKDRVEQAEKNPDAPGSAGFRRMRASAMWLAENFEVYPLILFAYGQATRPAARSSPRCGARSSPPAPKASAARSPVCSRSGSRR
jgi:nitroreductase